MSTVAAAVESWSRATLAQILHPCRDLDPPAGLSCVFPA